MSFRLYLNRDFGLALPRIRRLLWIQAETPHAFEAAEIVLGGQAPDLWTLGREREYLEE